VRHVVWEIVLLVWIVGIPVTLLALGELVAWRRRRVRYGAVSRSNSSGSGRRPAPGPRLRLSRTR
jgi:hypothetical protein